MNEHYDVVCIGAGPGGYTAAIRAAQLGKRVAVVELSKERVGGTCLNEGCIPVKALICRLQMSDIKKTISQLRNGVMYLFKKNNITLIEGKGRLIEKNKIKVGLPGGAEEIITAEFIVLAAGSRAQSIKGLEFDGKKIISSTDAINLDKIPASITIIGAGVIGVEFADIFSNLGAKVTLVEMAEHILPQEDDDISIGLERILKKKDIKIMTGTKLGRNDIDTDLILVSVGRAPNTDELELELDNGFVKTDSMMRTSQKNVFAVGDLINTPMFAHTAHEEAIIAAEYLCGLSPDPINYLNVPRIVYGDVETASIGFTEKEARENGCEIKAAKHFFKANSRSVINQKTEGFIKIIADSETQAFLGVHILGHCASEIIHPFIVAKTAGLEVNDMSRMVFGHPTISETIKDACKAVFERPIHG